MLLTVLTPTYNCAQTLPDTLQSVMDLQAQLPGNIEHLIGDAGSTDGSAGIISRYVAENAWAASYPAISLNIPATLNALLPHARGRWIVVLNGDDVFEVGPLRALMEEPQPERPSVLCGQVAVLSMQGIPLGARDCRPEQLGRFMSVNHPAMLVDRRVFDLIGPFEPSIVVAYDYAWTWRAFRSGVPFIRHPAILARARLGGISQTKASQVASEMLQTKLKAGCTLPALRDYLAYLVKAWFRKLLPTQTAAGLIRLYRRMTGSIENY